jgi:hypothetical protein
MKTSMTLCNLAVTIAMAIPAMAQNAPTQNSLSSAELLRRLEIKIEDSNEQALVDSVWSYLDEDGKGFTLQFLNKNSQTFKDADQKLNPQEKQLYVVAIFCDIYRNFKKGLYWLDISGQKLEDNLSDKMNDELFEKWQNDFDVYLVEFNTFYQKIIAENKAAIAENKAAIAEGKAIISKNIKEIEQKIKGWYQQYKDYINKDRVLQDGIKVKNIARETQSKIDYTPSADVEAILVWIEQQEKAAKEKQKP